MPKIRKRIIPSLSTSLAAKAECKRACDLAMADYLNPPVGCQSGERPTCMWAGIVMMTAVAGVLL